MARSKGSCGDTQGAKTEQKMHSAAIIAAIVTLFTTRNTASGFAASAALTMFAMFALGSKAFCNYYYFVIGAMCIALAAFPGPGEDEFISR